MESLTPRPGIREQNRPFVDLRADPIPALSFAQFGSKDSLVEVRRKVGAHYLQNLIDIDRLWGLCGQGGQSSSFVEN